MSGPKYTDYKLEQQRLLIIKAQLEAEIEKGKRTQIIDKINLCIDDLNKIYAKINIAKYENNILEADKVLNDKTIINELKKIIIKLKTCQSYSMPVAGNSGELAKILSSYKRNLNQAKNLITMTNQMMIELNTQYNEQVQKNLEEEFKAIKWSIASKASNLSNNLLSAYNAIIDQLIDTEDFEGEKKKYDEILNNHLYDDNYKISQMKMKFEAYLIEKQSETEVQNILQLRCEYFALSNLVFGECREVPNDIDMLKKSIARMMQEVQEEKIGEYVAQSIDRVMKELGYSIIGNEVLNTQKITKQHYDYSADSAITVASSENGAMMLEVVGKKKEDGTEGSTAAVKSDMERFCPDYQKVKEGLKQYGIILTEKKLCPPDEKYVRFAEIKKTFDRRTTARTGKKRMHNE